MTCHHCKVDGVLGFDLFTYFFGWDKQGEIVRRNAHSEKCRDELYAKWREWKASR